jgi:hypothetical protein
MMKGFHHAQLPVEGVMGLIHKRAGHGHLRVCKHRIPAGLLVLYPAPYPLAIGRSSRGGDVLDTVASPLAQGKHPQMLALARPVEQGMALGAPRLMDRGGDGRALLRECEERVAQAAAKMHPREERPQTLRGAVKAIGEHPVDPIRWLLLGGGASQRPIGLGHSCGPGVLRIAEGQSTRPQTIVGRYTFAVRQRLCCPSARKEAGSPHRVSTVPKLCGPSAHSRRERAIGEIA